MFAPSKTKTMLDPVVLFFVLGALAGLLKSDLKVPDSFYNVLSIYLLMAIGIKGGIELQKAGVNHIIIPGISTILLGLAVTGLAYFIAKKLSKLPLEDATAMAAHYGSVSAVTFAVAISFLKSKGVAYEEYMTVLLVLLEIPAIAAAIGYYKLKTRNESFNLKKLVHEIFLGKSILLLTGGLLIGMYIQFSGNSQLNFFFFDLFKGFLAIFMLEMGIIASKRIEDLKKAGIKILSFGIIMPLIAGTIGVITAKLCGLSVGGCTVLGTMAASASYIAAPAAVQIAIPKANPTLYLTSALGVTFPFNLLIGITLFYQLSVLINF